ncbi:MAG: 50S ribosomal protein L18 [Candidatus Shapirobacteria bacterium]
MTRLRLAVFRSNKQTSAQVIDDAKRKTVASASSIGIKDKGTKTEKAVKVGELVAKRALAKKVKKVVFDRRGRKYHGRIRALAEAARSAGLEF